MKTRQRILVAATHEGQDLARRALSQRYDLTFVSTLTEAQKVLADSEIAQELRSSFDLIICSVHFDDSRMFDLLQHVRNVDHYDKLPFLVITAMSSAVPLSSAVRTSSELLGAYGFLEFHTLPKREAARVLRDVVEQGFGKPVKAERTDKSTKKHSGEI